MIEIIPSKIVSDPVLKAIINMIEKLTKEDFERVKEIINSVVDKPDCTVEVKCLAIAYLGQYTATFERLPEHWYDPQ